MSELHERTARKYHGAMARNYEPKRQKQLRWHQENTAVSQMLSGLKPMHSVLDVPVGTGRFLPTYAYLRVAGYGFDTSKDMLEQAKRKQKSKHFKLAIGNLLTDPMPDVHTAVCVRFLDLIDEPAMQTAMLQLMKAASHTIVLTIRLGESYVLKSNTATHSTTRFKRLLSNNGWKIAEDVPIFTKGWHVLKLEKVPR